LLTLAEVFAAIVQAFEIQLGAVADLVIEQRHRVNPVFLRIQEPVRVQIITQITIHRSAIVSAQTIAKVEEAAIAGLARSAEIGAGLQVEIIIPQNGGVRGPGAGALNIERAERRVDRTVIELRIAFEIGAFHERAQVA